MRKSRLYPIVFGIAMAVVCSTLLKSLDAALRSRIDRNRTYDRKKNVVLVMVGRAGFGKMDQPAIEKVYEEQVREVKSDGSIAYYKFIDPATEKVSAYAIPLAGMGLWDKVKGLMSVETDRNTVRAVSFYDQKETPGLGGRIGEVEWVSQFDGKKIKDAAGAVAITITKSTGAPQADPNKVDGITAATMTCDAVKKLMQDSIKRFLERVKIEQ